MKQRLCKTACNDGATQEDEHVGEVRFSFPLQAVRYQRIGPAVQKRQSGEIDTPHVDVHQVHEDSFRSLKGLSLVQNKGCLYLQQSPSY